ncbi:MAG TPA: putative Ig domain-containing protein [Leptospiraceae bacterium]|nr:putative Ig domain-containing protein [Leptospiraceae bacterium]
MDRKFLQYSGVLGISSSGAAPSGLNYPDSPYSFTVNVSVGKKTPTVTGSVTDCTSNPALPTGLSIDRMSCTISGTPTVLQSQTKYTVTAYNSFGSTSTAVSIGVFTSVNVQFSFTSASLSDSGSSLALSAFGGPTSVNGKDGDTNGAYNFDGSSQYLSITNPSGLPTGSSPRTICAWANPRSFPAVSGTFIIANYGSATASSSFGLSMMNSAGTNQVGITGYNDDLSANYTVPLNAWTHICGVYDGTTASLYIDGKLFSSGAKSYNTGSSFLFIGAQSSLTQHFNGKIDEVRIYNTALTAAQIRQITVQVPSGLAARYDFNGNPAEVSGSGISLSSSGSFALTADRHGIAGNAYTFNGASSFSTAAPITVSNTGNITITAWIRPTNFNGAVNMIIVNGNGSFNGYGIYINGTASNVLTGIIGGVANVASSIAPPLNVWSHISLRATGTNWDLRLNGAPIGTLASAAPITPTVGTFIGSSPTNEFFTGDIDDVRVYNRALTDSEILVLAGYHPMQVSTWTATPATSSFKIHFQADSLSSLANGATVTTWNDNSGNGNHISAGVSPTYSSAGMNSKPAVNFARASTQYLTRAAAVGLGGDNFSMFSVFNPTIIGGDMGIFSIGSTCGYDKEQMISDITNYLQAGVCNVISIGASTNPVSSGISYIHSFTYQISSTGNVYLNGTSVVSMGTPATSYLGNMDIAVGRRMNDYTLAPIANTKYFNGLISEAIYYDGSLSNANRILVECYLSSKYNIVLDPGIICP